MRQLAIYLNDTEAGVLTERHPGSGYEFSYTEDYLRSAFPPISTTFPKLSGTYRAEHLFPFFSNMLPEGANRRIICRSLRIDETDLFGLLTAMAGKDFIGAVNVRRIDNDN